MRLRSVFVLAGTALLTVFVSACAAVAEHHSALFGKQPAQKTSAPANDADPISGEWNVSFFVHNSPTPATFTFKLEGSKVTGTAYSEHTGAGTIRDGKWADGKLSFTLDFEKHESIEVTGTLKDGKLEGEFHTEGFTDKWEAKKKAS